MSFAGERRTAVGPWLTCVGRVLAAVRSVGFVTIDRASACMHGQTSPTLRVVLVCVLALSFKGCEFLEVLSKILATMHLAYVSRVVYIFVSVDVRRVMLGLSNLE
jgi:hypothetical protein